MSEWYGLTSPFSSSYSSQVESFILARDLFLKPGGQVLPSAGHIYFCPFTDEALYNETDQKAQFFNTTLFGTDFRDLYQIARDEVFGQPVVGMFPPSCLLSVPSAPKSFDFHTVTKDELASFTIPVLFLVSRTALIHGLASWFDLDFFPRDTTIPQNAFDDEATLQSWDFNVMPQNAWPWAGAETGLNPGPTPPAPERGLPVTLSTGPQGE